MARWSNSTLPRDSDLTSTYTGRGNVWHNHFHHDRQKPNLDVKVTCEPVSFAWLTGWLEDHAQYARIPASAGGSIILMKFDMGQTSRAIEEAFLTSGCRERMLDRHPRIIFLQPPRNSKFGFRTHSTISCGEYGVRRADEFPPQKRCLLSRYFSAFLIQNSLGHSDAEILKFNPAWQR